MKVQDLSPYYKEPLICAGVISVLLLVLAMMVLDGGATLSATPFGLVAFWGVTVLVIIRRPVRPELSDIHFVKYGALWVFLIAQVLARWIWSLRGVDL